MIRHWQFPLLVVTTYIVTWVSVFVGLITHFFYSLVAHLFDRRDRTLRKLERNGDDREDEYYTIIIGAGFSGLGVGIKLKERGQNNFLIVERLSHIGGTWYANQYPGCAVDVSSDLYSYSFEPNPRWSTRYSAQPEVEDYLERCTQKYGLQPHIQLDTTVARCDWLEEKHVWKVTAMRKSSNETIYFYGRVLVGAYGILSNASYPKNIPGMDIFQGQMCHTAEWNKEIDFKEKRVAVIGTGSSAIQMVPQLHKNFGVSHLYVFQRTPGWVIPLPNRRITSVEKSIFTYFPFIQQCFRSWTYWANETLVLAFVHRWPTRWLLHCIYRYWLHLKVKDDNLRKKLTPSFDFGCKRILLSNDWYPTLQKSNVDLITTQIKEIKEHSIVTSDGCEYPVDVIVWSTGYQVHSIHIPMYGINGKSLSDQWSESSQAYRGMTVPNFPNLFLFLGPNTALGHNSVVIMIEAQLTYMIEALIYMQQNLIRAVSVRHDRCDQYNHDIQSHLKKTVWNRGGCFSWYLDPKGKNTTMWPGFTWTYILLLRNFDPENYHLIRTDQS